MSFLYLVVSSLLLGMLVGKYTTLDFGNLYEFMLYLLIFTIGIDIGKSKGLREELKKLGKLSLLLPASTVVGSLAGGFLASLLLKVPLKWGLAISAGFGWYSLT
ncbi:MAG TPA: DUF340 domain-containing protein, partial [Thermococcus litoralis]|nr:DUF340 domain-containing protein [Thermococcus litoralis]